MMLTTVWLIALLPAIEGSLGLTWSTLPTSIPTQTKYNTSPIMSKSLHDLHLSTSTHDSVYFVLENNSMGEDRLSAFASLNALPITKSSFDGASTSEVSSFVRDVSYSSLTSHITHTESPLVVTHMSLDEITKVSSNNDNDNDNDNDSVPRRVLMVKVPQSVSASQLDSAVSSVSSLTNTVFTVLGEDANKIKITSTNSRRLSDDYSETVNYVNMTPNILAGLLYSFFFIFVTIVGMSCMNQIEGQTTFISKMPGVGREA